MAAKKKRILTKEEKEKRRVSSLARYRRRVAEGVCLLCGDRAEDGTHYCRACRDFVNKRNRLIRKERAEHGLCTMCGKKMRETDLKLGFKRCAKCRSADAVRYYLRKKK